MRSLYHGKKNICLLFEGTPRQSAKKHLTWDTKRCFSDDSTANAKKAALCAAFFIILN